MALRGEFAQAVLLAVLEVTEDAYAVPIRQAVERLTNRTVSRGALYTALERLEEKGLLRSTTSAPVPTRGGKARRMYRVTPEGIRHLNAARTRLRHLWSRFDQQTGGANG